MHRLLAASCIAALAGSANVGFVTTAAAQDIPQHFRGSACIVSNTQGCVEQGMNVGNCATARFTPPGFHGPGTGYSLFWGFYAQNFFHPGSVVGQDYKNAVATQIGNGGSQYDARMRIPTQTPVNPANGVTLSMVIDVAGLLPQCTVRMRFTGQRFPLGSSSADEVSQLLDSSDGGGLSNRAASLGTGPSN